MPSLEVALSLLADPELALPPNVLLFDEASPLCADWLLLEFILTSLLFVCV